jgi:hypothetical protein
LFVLSLYILSQQLAGWLVVARTPRLARRLFRRLIELPVVLVAQMAVAVARPAIRVVLV